MESSEDKTESQRSLEELAEQCSQLASEMLSSLSKIGLSDKLRKRDALKAAFRMVWKEDEIKSQQGPNWDVQGILCYSKICTHVGCPTALYEQRTHHLLCPCHQSTFDLADSGKVVFGPAARSMPQLAITVDADGYLVAQHGFTQPVGPSFWERG